MSGESLDAAAIEELEREYIDRVWTDGEYEYVAESHADDFVGHWIGPEGGAVDVDGLEEMTRMIRGAFSDFVFDESFVFATDDMAAVGFEAGGTNDGEFMDIPPTDEHVMTTGIYVHRYEDGEIVEAWATWDLLTMLQQMGVVPAGVHLTDFLETALNLARRGILRRTQE